jgi:hypothetical protein
MNSTQSIADKLTKEKQLNQIAYYMAYCNSDMFDNLAKKRRLKNTIMDVLGGFILFSVLGIGSYYILNITI